MPLSCSFVTPYTDLKSSAESGTASASQRGRHSVGSALSFKRSDTVSTTSAGYIPQLQVRLYGPATTTSSKSARHVTRVLRFSVRLLSAVDSGRPQLQVHRLRAPATTNSHVSRRTLAGRSPPASSFCTDIARALPIQFGAFAHNTVAVTAVLRSPCISGLQHGKASVSF